MIQKAIITQYSDGSTVMSNIINKKGIPVIGGNNTYTATKVSEWYDGSNMDDSKVDGVIYQKDKSTGSYWKINLPNWGETFLEKDTMAQVRALTFTEVLLLKMGYYKGVKLNGYYTKGDTPASIEYMLSTTSIIDDGGSIIEVGGIKLEVYMGVNIDPVYFGAKSDLTTDNTTYFQKASDYARRINSNILLSSVGNGGYFIKNTVTIYNDIDFNRVKVTTNSDYKNLFNIRADNVTFKHHNIVTSKAPAVNAPVAIDLKGYSKIKIIDGYIKDSRIKAENVDLNNYYDIVLSGNIIDCDLTGYSVDTIQNDVFTFYNIVNLFIENNVITAKNVNRVGKISSFDGTGNVSTYNINITKNIINTETISPKQVFDFYQHARGVNFSYNNIKSIGHLSVIENKTTQLRPSNYFTDFKVIGNTFETDGTPLRMFGTYSSNQGNESGFQDVYFEGNTVNSSGGASANLINIMAFHYVSIKGNRFLKNTEDMSPVMRIGNCGSCDIIGNYINGLVSITPDNTIDQATYTPKFGKLKISGNEFVGKVGVAAAVINLINQITLGELSINDNIFDYKDSSLSGKRPMYYINTNISKLMSSGNIYNGNQGFSGTGSTIGFSKVKDNSWSDANPPVNFSRHIIVSSGTEYEFTPEQGNVLLEYIGSSNINIKVKLNSSLREGDSVYIKNSTNNTVTIQPDSGVNIQGNYSIQGSPSSLWLISQNGGATFRMVNRSTTATTLVKGLVNQSAKVDDVSSLDATDLATALTLVNELKTKLNAKFGADRTSGQQSTT